MSYMIKKINGELGHAEYETSELARESAMSSIDVYDEGFEIVDVSSNKVVYRDKREKANRIDLIDWD